MQPLVSIVLSSFNGARFIKAQLETLMNQTYTNIEIIVCDDKSQDETVAIVNSLKKNDKRISLYINEKNLGLNKNFEKGCSLANGDFIAICDQDDIWKSDKIESMLPFFTDHSIMLCHACSIRFTDNPPVHITSYDKRNLFTGNDVKKLFYFNTIAGHNIMFRRELLPFANPFNQNVYFDWWLVMSAAVHGNINATNKVLTYHRLHQHNVTLGKKDEKYQTKEKAKERQLAASSFLEMNGLKKEDIKFGKKLLHHLNNLQPKKFSIGLFLFLIKNSNAILFFKKSIFSRIKISYRLSWAK